MKIIQNAKAKGFCPNMFALLTLGRYFSDQIQTSIAGILANIFSFCCVVLDYENRLTYATSAFFTLFLKKELKVFYLYGKLAYLKSSS